MRVASDYSQLNLIVNMNPSAIKDLHYEWYLKIGSKLHDPSGECNLKEFSNFTSLKINPNCPSFQMIT